LKRNSPEVLEKRLNYIAEISQYDPNQIYFVDEMDWISKQPVALMPKFQWIERKDLKKQENMSELKKSMFFHQLDFMD